MLKRVVGGGVNDVMKSKGTANETNPQQKQQPSQQQKKQQHKSQQQ